MTIPNYQNIMGPLLREVSDGNEYTRGKLTEKLSEFFDFSEEEKRMHIPSKTDFVFRNRVGWSNFHLKKAGLIESKRLGLVKITKEGLKALKTDKTIDKEFLKQYPKYQKFITD